MSMNPGTSILNPNDGGNADHGALRAWDNADLNWSSRGWAAVEYLAESGCEFAADDLFEDGIALAPPDHPNRVGGLFMACHKAGLIRPVGYRTSRRSARHGGVQRTWVGAHHE